MTAPEPPVDLDQLETALAAGSKLPWGLVGGTHDRDVIDDHGCHVAATGTFPDAAAIVAAVNAAPALIAELRDLRAKRDAVEALAEELSSGLWHVDVAGRLNDIVRCS